MKKILISILLLFVGLVGGLIIGSLTAGYGGGVAGICIYNDVALKSKIITEAQSMQLAKELATRLDETDDKNELQWLIENTEVADSDTCSQFFDTFKKELKPNNPQEKWELYSYKTSPKLMKKESIDIPFEGHQYY